MKGIKMHKIDSVIRSMILTESFIQMKLRTLPILLKLNELSVMDTLTRELSVNYDTLKQSRTEVKRRVDEQIKLEALKQ